jgi:magnesium transporter
VTTELRPGPVPLSRVWNARKVIAEDLTGEDLGDILELHSDAYAWWVLPRGDGYGEGEVRRMAESLGLDRLALRDVLAADRRAKFEMVGTARLVMTNAITLDQERVEVHVHPVSVVVTERALICLVEDTPGFRPASLLAAHADTLAGGGVEAALQWLMTAAINTYENTVQWLEDASDDLADQLFDERPLSKPQQLRAFRLRTALSQVRRLTEPMRTVLADVLASPASATHGRKATGSTQVQVHRRWTLISEHHQRVANAADALREALSSIFDTSLALSDLRMNEIMKKLTGWAAIIAVPTLISGFVGMNVNFPLDGTTAGFWFYFALMLVTAVVLYVVYKLKQWI